MLYVAILASVENSNIIIRTSESMQSLNTSINKARKRIVLISIIILIVIIPLVIITSRLITRPLFLIGKAAKKISKGDMMDPIPISQKSFFSGTEEISSITVALNEMAKDESLPEESFGQIMNLLKKSIKDDSGMGFSVDQ